ncbi:MAG: hypothetical protein V4505_04625 [Pseudomonadota bacterium]
MSLFDILQGALNGANPEEHFDRVAQNASTGDLGAGLAAAMRSDQTPDFGAMVGQMFGQSSPGQQAGALNQILATLGPTLTAAVASGAAGGVLGRILQPGQTQLTPDQASQLSPADAADIANAAHAQHPAVLDEVSQFYAQHSGLIKILGGAALTLAMTHMKKD